MFFEKTLAVAENTDNYLLTANKAVIFETQAFFVEALTKSANLYTAIAVFLQTPGY